VIRPEKREGMSNLNGSVDSERRSREGSGLVVRVLNNGFRRTWPKPEIYIDWRG